jgi:hypothetical protein
MLLTGHFFFPDYEMNKEPLFVARCEQILSSTPNIPSSSAGSTKSTILQFVLDDQLNINEISSKYAASIPLSVGIARIDLLV